MTYTLNESGKVMTITQEDITLPADYSFAVVNDFVHSFGITFEEVQALCLGMADYIERMQRGECICTRCGVRQDGRPAGEMPDF